LRTTARTRIEIFASNANDNVTPYATISGIVANEGTSCCNGAGNVVIFAPGATGNATPVARLSGPLTGLREPSGIAVDSTGSIWVSDAVAEAIFRFAPAANGNVAPIQTISGPATTLSDAWDVRLF
jgi:hypothetical protein